MAYASNSRRALAFLLISSSLMSCTADGLVPPAPIDRGSRVSAIKPTHLPVQQEYSAQGYGAQPQPVAQTDYAYHAMEPPQQMAAASPEPRQMGAPPRSLGTLTYSANGVNADDALGVNQTPAPTAEPRVVGLAEEQNNDIAEGASSQPVVDGIGTNAPYTVKRRTVAATQPIADEYAPAPPPVQKRTARPARQDVAETAPRWNDRSPVVAPSRVQEASPQEVAMLMPRNPTAAPQSSRTDISPMPASEASCRAQLKRLGVQFRDKPRISDGPSCGIDYPVELVGLSGNIQVSPAVTLNCQTTLAFAQWVKNELAPAARIRYLTGVGRIEPMGGYSCRRMNNSRQRYNPMSEHARGNAIDVGRFVLKNGHEIDVRKKGLFSFREGALLKSVRSDSCKYFNTVLGPGSNKEHWNHFHFDLRSRASGNRYCD
ncbi:extensin family protein [Rhizobium helianthi]|uniref:Extensin family protein n=1 Tax=Rhizobium helianthi TaxID=1132695 RepID=A0ABW4LYD6_9HYPH